MNWNHCWQMIYSKFIGRVRWWESKIVWFRFKATKSEYAEWKKRIEDGRKHIQLSTDQSITQQYKSYYDVSDYWLEKVRSNSPIFFSQDFSSNLNEQLESLVQKCEDEEKSLMQQFGETDINEFNYDRCCFIFRQLIDQVERAIKVKNVVFSREIFIVRWTELFSFHHSLYLGTRQTLGFSKDKQ